MNETLDQKLAALKLGRMRQVYTGWIERSTVAERYNRRGVRLCVAVLPIG